VRTGHRPFDVTLSGRLSIDIDPTENHMMIRHSGVEGPNATARSYCHPLPNRPPTLTGQNFTFTQEAMSGGSSSTMYVEVDAFHQGSTSSEQAERAKMNLYSIRCHLPGTHLPHPSWSRSCSRPLLCDTGTRDFTRLGKGVQHGFPQGITIQGARTDRNN